jgi:hypothetical protein
MEPRCRAAAVAGDVGFYGTDGRWELISTQRDLRGNGLSCGLTVIDGLGSSVTVALPHPSY